MKVGFLIMLVVNGDAILYTKTKEYHEGWCDAADNHEF